ncbi:hypothetical protein [Stappia sp. ES.058]|uniref:hypothetical protein n=1 Tax=Stappia sp. ES.058 TaxID=1881061 RepID=UPI00087B33CF|nr:hypothetical protein [Stappia sp. ES.058]SDU46394.1 hypothetical protein SAMN05428979_4076 [Stappia sp. ES.058]
MAGHAEENPLWNNSNLELAPETLYIASNSAQGRLAAFEKPGNDMREASVIGRNTIAGDGRLQ